MPLTIEPGDATDASAFPYGCIIAHVVNDVGAWGKGFVVPLAKRYPRARSEYRHAWRKYKLGGIQTVTMRGEPVVVANMFAQHGIGTGRRRLRYGALRRCLRRVAVVAREIDATILMPKIGCGLAGGDWDVVRGIIEEETTGVDVVVRVC